MWAGMAHKPAPSIGTRLSHSALYHHASKLVAWSHIVYKLGHVSMETIANVVPSRANILIALFTAGVK